SKACNASSLRCISSRVRDDYQGLHIWRRSLVSNHTAANGGRSKNVASVFPGAATCLPPAPCLSFVSLNETFLYNAQRNKTYVQSSYRSRHRRGGSRISGRILRG